MENEVGDLSISLSLVGCQLQPEVRKSKAVWEVLPKRGCARACTRGSLPTKCEAKNVRQNKLALRETLPQAIVGECVLRRKALGWTVQGTAEVK